jgi:TolA-binding protein
MTKRIFLLFLGLGMVFLLSAQEEQIFREAERRFAGGDYQFAYSRYARVIEDYPNSRYAADAVFRQALILTYLGKNEEALQRFSRVLERYPNTRFYRYIPFWEGFNLFQLERYEEALEKLKLSLRDGNDSLVRDSLFYKGLIEKKIGRREDAFETAQKLFSLYKDPVENPEMLLLYTSLLVETGRYGRLYELFGKLRFDLLDEEVKAKLALYRGEALFLEGRYKEAEPVYLELLDRRDETQAVAYKRLYVLYGVEGKIEKQQKVFDEAQIVLADRPELLAEFLLRAGIQSYREGKYDLSRSYLRRIQRTLPRNRIDGLVPLYLAHILEKEGNAEAAVSLLREVLQDSNSRREELLLALARLEAKLQRWGSAADAASEFLGEFPESEHISEANYLYAYALYREGNVREALAVVSESFSTGKSGEYDQDLLRLRSRLHMRVGKNREAIEDLREYLPGSPGDLEAWVDLGRLYFEEERYGDLQNLVESLLEEIGNIPEGEKAASYYKLLYIEGVSLLKQGEYHAALEAFSVLDAEKMVRAGLDELVPHFLFYKGWSEYKLVNYAAANRWFEKLLESFPDSPRAVEAAYLYGWAAYASADYFKARDAFGRYSRMDVSEEKKIRGLFMYAKSSAALGRSDDALIVYRSIYQDYPNSLLADDSLYEYAGLLQRLGRIEEAAATYYSLYRGYPTSPLGEEALYRRGELYFQKGEYRKARDAFYEHRLRYPEGKMLDLSLYWSGKAALAAGQPYGAVLVWEKLVSGFPKSGFLDETLRELAGLYTELGEYQKALSYYTRFVSSFPEQGREEKVREQLETLKRIIAGENAQEAALTVRLEREGLDSRKGREAALELARIYLYQYMERNESAYDLIKELIKIEDDPSITAKAWYLQGEYFRKKGEPGMAAESYVRAALTGAGDDDLVARSLFRAAQSAMEAGDTETARRMVQKLRADFPHTQWVLEGENLLNDRTAPAGRGN